MALKLWPKVWEKWEFFEFLQFVLLIWGPFLQLKLLQLLSQARFSWILQFLRPYTLVITFLTSPGRRGSAPEVKNVSSKHLSKACYPAGHICKGTAWQDNTHHIVDAAWSLKCCHSLFKFRGDDCKLIVSRVYTTLVYRNIFPLQIPNQYTNVWQILASSKFHRHRDPRHLRQHATWSASC